MPRSVQRETVVVRLGPIYGDLVNGESSLVRGVRVAGWMAVVVAALISANAWATANKDSGTLAGPWSFMVAIVFTGFAAVALGAVSLSQLIYRRRPALSGATAAIGLAVGGASPAIALGWIALQTWG